MPKIIIYVLPTTIFFYFKECFLFLLLLLNGSLCFFFLILGTFLLGNEKKKGPAPLFLKTHKKERPLMSNETSLNVVNSLFYTHTMAL